MPNIKETFDSQKYDEFIKSTNYSGALSYLTDLYNNTDDFDERDALKPFMNNLRQKIHRDESIVRYATDTNQVNQYYFLDAIKNGTSIEQGKNSYYDRYTNGLGLEAKNPNGNWTLKEHLVNGSGKASWQNDPYISTTSDFSVAEGFNQAGSGHGIVKIDINKVPSPQFKGYEIYPRTNGVEGLPYHYSFWQQEISVYKNIPAEAIVDFFK